MRPLDNPPKIQYIRDVFTQTTPAMREAEKHAKEQTLPIHIGAEEGKILECILKWNNVKTVVEMGTLTGFSSLWMAKAVGEDGHIYTVETQEKFVNIARDVFKMEGVDDRIDVFHGPAPEKFAEFEDQGPFDAIFIDADKTLYVEVLNWAEKHIKKGGLIIGDNTFLFDAVFKEELPEGIRPLAKDVMLEFNARLANPEKYEAMMLPTKEGMTIAKKLF